MINFMLKHPIVTYLIVDRIAVMVERICERRAGSPIVDEVVEVVSEKGKKFNRKDKETEEKEPMGFHFNKEAEEPKIEHGELIFDELTGMYFRTDEERIKVVRDFIERLDMPL